MFLTRYYFYKQFGQFFTWHTFANTLPLLAIEEMTTNYVWLHYRYDPVRVLMDVNWDWTVQQFWTNYAIITGI